MLALGLSQRTAVWAGLPPDAVWDSGLFSVLAAFCLSRLLLVLSNPFGFLGYPLLLLRVPSLTAAGMLATSIAALLWLRWRGLPVWRVLDAWAPCATVVWAFVALGHFAEGSDPGLPARFGVRFPGDASAQIPVALYAAGYALSLTGGLLTRLRRGQGTLAMALLGAGAGQFLLGFLRQPDESGITTLLDPLQWVAAGMIVVALALSVSGAAELNGKERGPDSAV